MPFSYWNAATTRRICWLGITALNRKCSFLLNENGTVENSIKKYRSNQMLSDDLQDLSEARFVAMDLEENPIWKIGRFFGNRELNTSLLNQRILNRFNKQVLTVSQEISIDWKWKTTIKEIYSVDSGADKTALEYQGKIIKKVPCGILSENSRILFNKTGTSETMFDRHNDRNRLYFLLTLDSSQISDVLGIGGLDSEISEILNKCFNSRLLRDDYGIDHVKGILLYGPPGTGKTLIATQISKFLNASKITIVSGPEIFNMYVGQSEANIRALFAEAEEEQKRRGINSGLHVIIIDEIDAICKKRSPPGGDSNGVNDSVVNQLLAKMDGVEKLNNILIIGTTNRLEAIDEAFLRTGRFELIKKIDLPNMEGRTQILKIHTEKLKAKKKLSDDVKLDELAGLTANFSGADLKGLVNSALDLALQSAKEVRGVDSVSRNKSSGPDDLEKFIITMDHFKRALNE